MNEVLGENYELFHFVNIMYLNLSPTQ